MPGNPSTVRRVAAGLALIIAPTLFLLADIISPAWSDDTAQHVQQVDENPGRQGVYGLLSVLGFTLLVPGIIGIVHLIRGPGMTLAHIGGGLAVIGFGAGPALAGSGVTDAVAVDTIGPEAYTVLLEGLQENAAWILLVLLIAIPSLLSVILMAMAVWRSGFA
ncbi:MAG TPA: hypothetical protein VN213_14360, partial [Solirubrobacteraceae bacterium]|nr:hypothetical protein [Solirubrobacteraceae bacterium]